MEAPDIVPAGSITFGAHISNVNQFLRANGLANGPPASDGSGSVAIVPVPSWVYAIAWNFERNTSHEFRLIHNGKPLRWLDFPTASGVIQFPEPHLVDRLDAGDVLQISSTYFTGVNFPGPITVTLYLAELL